MREGSTVEKLRFMDLMQRCMPFTWQRYWDCGTHYFDVSLMLHETGNQRVGKKERTLLGLLARIGSGRVKSPRQLFGATRGLDREHRKIVRRWLKAGDRRHFPVAANPEPLAAVDAAQL
jgi:hypothetical protein